MQKLRFILFLIVIVISANQVFAQSAAERGLAGTDLEYPALIPGLGLERFGIDRIHSDLSFSIGFLGLNRVRGSFNKYDGALVYHDDKPEKTSITLIIKTESIDTGSNFRDKDLRSERFFHVDEYPTILFQSTSIVERDGYLTAYGELTIRGVKKNVSFPLVRTFPRTLDKGWGNVRVGFSGTLTIDRTDFGIQGGDFWGIDVLSDDVEISFSILGTSSNVDRWGWPRGDKPSIGEEILSVINESGLNAGLERYAELKSSGEDQFSFGEDHLLAVAYKLRQHRHLREAIAVFEIAEEEYTESVDVQEGLGLTLALAGKEDQALGKFYRVLELDPQNASALEMLRVVAEVGAQ